MARFGTPALTRRYVVVVLPPRLAQRVPADGMRGGGTRGRRDGDAGPSARYGPARVRDLAGTGRERRRRRGERVRLDDRLDPGRRTRRRTSALPLHRARPVRL